MITRSSIQGRFPVKKLSEVVDFLDSRRKPITAADRIAGPHPYYGANGQQDSIAGYIFDEPLVLLAEDGGLFDQPDRGIAYSIEGKTWVNNHAHVLRPKACADIRFILRVLQNYDVTPWITGSTRAKLTKAGASNIEIPLPPLAEQKRIAAILDAADALRTKRRESLAQLDALLQSTFLTLFGDPVENPMGWERKTLGEIINFIGGSQPPKETFTYEPGPGKIRLVQIRDFKSDRFQTYIPEKLARRPFKEDDVMIARYGPPVFQILRGLSGSYNVALMKAEPIGPVENLFIFHLLSQPKINAAVVAKSERTAGQTGVNLQFLNNYSAYLPPLPLQQKFAAIVESVERQKAAQRAHLAELDALFAALQHRAFRGEL
jgi:type I restriction enzyme S subunit